MQHVRNLRSYPRVSIEVEMPGWEGAVAALDVARVTLFGDCYQLSPELSAAALSLFQAKHTDRPTSAWANTVFFRMHRVVDLYFVGGFGTVQFVDVDEYERTPPDAVIRDDVKSLLAEVNVEFRERLARLHDADDVTIVSIDARGVDVRVRRGEKGSVVRYAFSSMVENKPEAIAELTLMTGAYAS